jgi:hypothetical protein
MSDDPRDLDNRPRLLRGPEIDFDHTDDELSETVASKIASITNPATRSILYAAAAIAWCCAIVAILSTPAAIIGAWRILL